MLERWVTGKFGDDLARAAPGFDWPAFFKAAELGAPARVVVAENTALSARQTMVTNQVNQIVASLDLITAMGGGWSTAQQPGN